MGFRLKQTAYVSGVTCHFSTITLPRCPSVFEDGDAPALEPTNKGNLGQVHGVASNGVGDNVGMSDIRRRPCMQRTYCFDSHELSFQSLKR